MCWLGWKESAPGAGSNSMSMERSEPIAGDGGAVSAGRWWSDYLLIYFNSIVIKFIFQLIILLKF